MNWGKIAVGGAIVLVGLVVEPTPLMEAVGLGIIAEGATNKSIPELVM